MATIIAGQTPQFYHWTSDDFLQQHNKILQLAAYAQVTIVYEHQTDVNNVTLKFVLNNNSSLLLIPILGGGNHLKLSIELQLDDAAQAIVHGLYTLNGAQEITINTMQHHKGARATSHLIMNGIIADQSRLHYSGTIKIEKQAHKTVAGQENKTIILGEQAQVISVPALEVETNDVQCAHGSAMGPLNHEHIHYMQSRGLSEYQAKKLLFSSFFYQCLHRLQNKNDSDRMLNQLIAKILAKDTHE